VNEGDGGIEGEHAMRVEPLGDKVVIKRLEPDQKTAGGIVLPDAARDKPQQGRVLSVGDGRQLPNGIRVPHQVREGDRVVFSRYAGTEVVVDDEEVLIMGEDEILAILE
jgi:chaperonin GroES